MSYYCLFIDLIKYYPCYRNSITFITFIKYFLNPNKEFTFSNFMLFLYRYTNFILNHLRIRSLLYEEHFKLVNLFKINFSFIKKENEIYYNLNYRIYLTCPIFKNSLLIKSNCYLKLL